MVQNGKVKYVLQLPVMPANNECIFHGNNYTQICLKERKLPSLYIFPSCSSHWGISTAAQAQNDVLKGEADNWCMLSVCIIESWESSALSALYHWKCTTQRLTQIFRYNCSNARKKPDGTAFAVYILICMLPYLSLWSDWCGLFDILFRLLLFLEAQLQELRVFLIVYCFAFI